MNRTDITTIIQSILVEHFHIVATTISWDSSLEELNENFKFLGFLLEFEQLIQARFNTEILLVEYISANIHTPNDIVELIYKTIKGNK